MARELFLVVDQKGWELAEEKHKESGKSNIFNYEKDLEVLQGLPKTEIAFYRESSGQRQDGTFCQSKLLKLLGTDRVVLDKTPFYAESGGQLGDTGWITGSHFRFRVEDTQKQGELIVHYGTLEEGNLDQLPEEVLAQVEVERRKALMANHSATHLLHWALRDILGSSITQQGSLVAPDRLRFDFSSPAPLTTAQLREIEEKVNTAILENHRVCTQYEELESAKKKGALAMFGEKYAAQVRVVEMSNSKELCGGTHVEATGDIGLFSILSESPIQAGVRRITALTRWEALKRVQEDRELLESLGSHFKSPQNELKTRIFQLQEDLKQEKKEREYLEDKLVSFLGSALKQQALYQNSIHILVKKVEDAVDLKKLAHAIYDSEKDYIGLLASTRENKVSLVTFASSDLLKKHPIHLGKKLAEWAKMVGGRGGGHPDFAQGGGPDIAASRFAFTKSTSRSPTPLLGFKSPKPHFSNFHNAPLFFFRKACYTTGFIRTSTRITGAGSVETISVDEEVIELQYQIENTLKNKIYDIVFLTECFEKLIEVEPQNIEYLFSFTKKLQKKKENALASQLLLALYERFKDSFKERNLSRHLLKLLKLTFLYSPSPQRTERRYLRSLSSDLSRERKSRTLYRKIPN
jgi:alanyl-tRNA synthetase